MLRGCLVSTSEALRPRWLHPPLSETTLSRSRSPCSCRLHGAKFEVSRLLAQTKPFFKLSFTLLSQRREKTLTPPLPETMAFQNSSEVALRTTFLFLENHTSNFAVVSHHGREDVPGTKHVPWNIQYHCSTAFPIRGGGSSLEPLAVLLWEVTKCSVARRTSPSLPVHKG